MKTIKLVNGPERQSILESFVKTYSGDKKKVTFVAENNMCYVGHLLYLEYCDKSGATFNFKGLFNGHRTLQGFYDSRSHKGWIEDRPLGQ